MRFSHERSIPQSLREYGRGIAGGLIFSLPLLYTMEIWEAGLVMHPARMIWYVALTFCLLMLYNRYAGLRRDATFREVVIDSVEEMGIGLLLSAGVMFLLMRVGSNLSLEEIVSRVVMEGMTVAIGVSVGTAQLGTTEADDSCGMAGDGRGGENDYLGQTAIALCGAVLFAANIAPTDEVGVLAREISPWRLLLIMGVSLVMGVGVLYFAEFRGSQRYADRAKKSHAVRDVLTTYAMALLAAAGVLYFFGRLETDAPVYSIAQIVVVGVPAMLGASAGRLLLQPDADKNEDPADS